MKEYDDEIELEGEEELELLERKDYVELESDEAERERLEPKVSVESDLVNSVVVDPNFDDVTLPSLTFRVVLIGLYSFYFVCISVLTYKYSSPISGTALCILGASISQLFFFKSNAPSL